LTKRTATFSVWPFWFTLIFIVSSFLPVLLFYHIAFVFSNKKSGPLRFGLLRYLETRFLFFYLLGGNE